MTVKPDTTVKREIRQITPTVLIRKRLVRPVEHANRAHDAMRTTLTLSFLAILVTGCVNTEHIGRSPPETSFAAISQELAGRKVQITLRDGTQRAGRFISLSTDSVRWRGADGQAVAVPTERVHAITTNDRWTGLAEGAGIGAAVGAATFGAFYLLAESQGSLGLFGAGMLAGAMAVIGGVIEGIHEGGKHRYVLMEKERRE